MESSVASRWSGAAVVAMGKEKLRDASAGSHGLVLGVTHRTHASH